MHKSRLPFGVFRPSPLGVSAFTLRLKRDGNLCFVSLFPFRLKGILTFAFFFIPLFVLKGYQVLPFSLFPFSPQRDIKLCPFPYKTLSGISCVFYTDEDKIRHILAPVEKRALHIIEKKDIKIRHLALALTLSNAETERPSPSATSHRQWTRWHLLGVSAVTNMNLSISGL